MEEATGQTQLLRLIEVGLVKRSFLILYRIYCKWDRNGRSHVNESGDNIHGITKTCPEPVWRTWMSDS